MIIPWRTKMGALIAGRFLHGFATAIPWRTKAGALVAGFGIYWLMFIPRRTNLGALIVGRFHKCARVDFRRTEASDFQDRILGIC